MLTLCSTLFKINFIKYFKNIIIIYNGGQNSKTANLANHKPCKTKKGKTKKLSPWNKFVAKVYAKEKKNGKSFSDCLKIAGKLKAEGKMKL